MSDSTLFFGLFVGLAHLILVSVFAWGLYHILRKFKSSAEVEEIYDTYEGVLVKDKAKTRGVFIDKEMLKKQYCGRKSIREYIEEEIIKDFKKDKKK